LAGSASPRLNSAAKTSIGHLYPGTPPGAGSIEARTEQDQPHAKDTHPSCGHIVGLAFNEPHEGAQANCNGVFMLSGHAWRPWAGEYAGRRRKRPT